MEAVSLADSLKNDSLNEDNPEEEQQAASLEKAVCKKYRRYTMIEFHEKLLVSVMINVKSFGRKDMPFVKWLLCIDWHIQIKDEKLHPRPKGFELFGPTQQFTCFKSQAEWSQCDQMGKGRGTGSSSSIAATIGENSAPAMTAHCLNWAETKFAKWLLIVREMQNDIHPLYVNACFVLLYLIFVHSSHHIFAGKHV
jgi:hypothetical protein